MLLIALLVLLFSCQGIGQPFRPCSVAEEDWLAQGGSQQGSGNGRHGSGRNGAAWTFQTGVPAHPFDFILARPTGHSVTASMLAYCNMEGYLAWRTSGENLSGRSPLKKFIKGEPAEVLISGLHPDSRYTCRFHYRAPADNGFTSSQEYSFHTARAPGRPFIFTITADSHLDDRTSIEIYTRTLTNALADGPDFHIDLGDTFMTDKHACKNEAARQYLAQRWYFGLLCHSAPLFLVLGNHDGETARDNDGTSGSLAAWSAAMRKRYFPNPVPDSFYRGNSEKNPHVGLLEDYYSWHWGDALFIVLDPFWYSERQRGGDDNWKATLGTGQYQWLRHTLEKSRARYRFVFIHHLVGGLDRNARGGAETARLFEWGGSNPDGSFGFKEKRPGWPAPIHQLLVDHHVSVVFHGHDHFYARQELDGIVYQLVPQPGFPGSGSPRQASDYGYKDGVMRGGPGYLRVSVSGNGATVDYMRSWLAGEKKGKNCTADYSYSLPAPSPSTRKNSR